jgi:cobyrinic acid a,c-diamide synthase
MWGLVAADAIMGPKFSALDDVTAVAERRSLIGPDGTVVRGHEFHYSELKATGGLRYTIRLDRRQGSAMALRSAAFSPDMPTCTSVRTHVSRPTCSALSSRSLRTTPCDWPRRGAPSRV